MGHRQRMAEDQSPLPPDDLRRKVIEFEHFVHAKLEPDLKAVVTRRDAIYDEISDYLRLQKTCETLRDSVAEGTPDLKTQVDLGCQVYMQAHVKDASRIRVEVGLGFFV